MMRVERGPSSARVPVAIAALAVFGATWAAFWPAGGGAFVSWDDYANLRDNPHFRGFGGEQLRWMLTAMHFGHYQPVTWLTFALDHAITGVTPAGVHRTNILMHAMNAAVFLLLSRRVLTLSRPACVERAPGALLIGATTAALIFSLHPLRVESVAWATERRDLVSGFFAMLAVLAYLRAHTRSDVASRRWWIAACLALFALGALAKVIVTLLPLVLVVLDAYPLRRRLSIRTVFVEKLPLFVASFLVGGIGIAAASNVQALHTLVDHGISDRILQLLYSLTFYVHKTLLPVGLAPLYELPEAIRPTDLRFAASAAIAIAISMLLFRLRRRWPAGLAVWACYVVWLLPVSGLSQNGPQITADRYSYLSCMGLAVLVGGAVARTVAARATARTAVVLIGGIACVALGSLTWWQTASGRTRRRCGGASSPLTLNVRSRTTVSEWPCWKTLQSVRRPSAIAARCRTSSGPWSSTPVIRRQT